LKRWTRHGKYRKTHRLLDLANEIQRKNPPRQVIARFPASSLEFVTECGKHTKYESTLIIARRSLHSHATNRPVPRVPVERDEGAQTEPLTNP
jgi:hypothetical protein